MQKAKAAEELTMINQNDDLPIDGTLFYLSNVDDYEKLSPSDLKRYRKFERKSFENFYHSDAFKMLCSGCFRAEIHFDEAGAMHLQMQSFWFHKNKAGTATYSKRACLKDELVKFYSSEAELNKRLDLLSELHQQQQASGKSWADLIGTKRIDARLYDRIEVFHDLSGIALQNTKQMGVDWKPVTTYRSDQVHRNRANYLRLREDKKCVNAQQAKAEHARNREQCAKYASDKMENELQTSTVNSIR